MKQFARFFAEATHQLSNWDAIVSSSDLLQKTVSLLNELEALGGEAYIVGGAVRDIFLKTPAHDIDISTNVPLDVISKNFKTNELGRSAEFGIIVVHWEGEQFEVAQFRKDSATSADGRRPDSISLASSFEDDSSRRDLSFNAMGLTKDGLVIDYHGGIDDLNNKLVRTVGKASQRFNEDGLRILRALRFAAKMGFEIEKDTRDSASKLKHLLNNISPERIKDELFKAAANGPSLARYIRHLDDTNILKDILPEIYELKDKPHNPIHHPEGGAYEHTLAAVSSSKSKDPVQNIAVLLHDIGKGLTLAYIDGQPTYHGHEAVSAELANKIGTRLRMTNDQKEAIEFAAAHHMKGHNIDKLTDKNILKLRQSPHWDTLYNTIYSDEASRGSLFDPTKFQQKMDHVEALYQKYGDSKELEARMSALIDGKLIMSVIPGIQGAQIGLTKNAIRDWILDNEFNVTADDVVNKIKELNK
jgi:tRNA nucleotidyltransferase (CCA-adding enzyme)